MTTKKAPIVALIVSICFAQGSANAAEQRRPNPLKVAAVALASVLAGHGVAQHLPTDNVMLSLAVGTATGNLVALGSGLGTYAGAYATDRNPVGCFAGGCAGTGVAVLSSTALGLTHHLYNQNNTIKVAGMYLGGTLGITTTLHMALN